MNGDKEPDGSRAINSDQRLLKLGGSLLTVEENIALLQTVS